MSEANESPAITMISNANIYIVYINICEHESRDTIKQRNVDKAR